MLRCTGSASSTPLSADRESLGIMYFARYHVPINYIALLIFTVVDAFTLSVATIVIGNSVFFEILLILAISSVFLAKLSQITHKVKGEDGVVQRNMYEEEDLPIDIFSAVCCFIIIFQRLCVRFICFSLCSQAKSYADLWRHHDGSVCLHYHRVHPRLPYRVVRYQYWAHDQFEAYRLLCLPRLHVLVCLGCHHPLQKNVT